MIEIAEVKLAVPQLAKHRIGVLKIAGGASNLALTFQVKDSGSPVQSKSVNLTLTIAPATLAISTSSLPNGLVGLAYNATLGASGGTTPYAWTLMGGILPSFLQESETKTIRIKKTEMIFLVFITKIAMN